MSKVETILEEIRADAARSIGPGEENGRSLRRFRGGGHGCGGGGGAAAGGAAPAEEKTEFSVVLTTLAATRSTSSSGREVTSLGLKEAKDS